MEHMPRVLGYCAGLVLSWTLFLLVVAGCLRVLGWAF